MAVRDPARSQIGPGRRSEGGWREHQTDLHPPSR